LKKYSALVTAFEESHEEMDLSGEVEGQEQIRSNEGADGDDIEMTEDVAVPSNDTVDISSSPNRSRSPQRNSSPPTKSPVRSSPLRRASPPKVPSSDHEPEVVVPPAVAEQPPVVDISSSPRRKSPQRVSQEAALDDSAPSPTIEENATEDQHIAEEKLISTETSKVNGGDVETQLASQDQRQPTAPEEDLQTTRDFVEPEAPIGLDANDSSQPTEKKNGRRLSKGKQAAPLVTESPRTRRKQASQSQDSSQSLSQQSPQTRRSSKDQGGKDSRPSSQGAKEPKESKDAKNSKRKRQTSSQSSSKSSSKKRKSGGKGKLTAPSVDEEDDVEMEEEVIEEEEEGDEEFVVEAIITHKRSPQGGLLYHIKWLGYPSSENSWEPCNIYFHSRSGIDFSLVENLDGCIELVKAYHRHNKLPWAYAK
jgi:hypothetical protein